VDLQTNPVGAQGLSSSPVGTIIMAGFTPIVVEGLCFLAVFAIANVLTRPLRQAISDHENPDRGVLQGARNLIGTISRPLAVLVISELALEILRLNSWLNQYLLQIPEHITAWLSFWLVVLSIKLVEGLARQAYIFRGRPFPVPELLASLMRNLLFVASAFIVIKSILDIDISPLLASTALVTAVVGFALQGVLSNLLAGMSLHVTRSVLPSDWVRIDDVEGKVIETNWRETRLQTYGGHILVVPNSTVANATIHNMTRPTPSRRHSLPVGASYADPPGEVIDALVQSALSVPEVLRDPPPDAIISAYQDFGINYLLRYWTQSFQRRQTIDGAVARMVWYQFKRRGIEIPFPMSDRLLDDFMTVVSQQRRLPSEDGEIARRIDDLKGSDFCTQILVDAEGNPMLQDEDLILVAGKMRRLRYTSGEILFVQGDPGDSCYVVVSGHLHGRMEYADATRAVEFEVGPGALVGEMSLMTGLPRTATVSVREEVDLLEIPQDAFACLLGLHPEIPTLLSQLAADRGARNAAALEQLQRITTEDLAQTLGQKNILKRFLRIIGYRDHQG
jgi:small-conductance mechanosensitive channel/CRP-like cAMP-binding protein